MSHSALFENFIIFCILCNCVTLGMSSNRQGFDETIMGRTLNKLEYLWVSHSESSQRSLWVSHSESTQRYPKTDRTSRPFRPYAPRHRLYRTRSSLTILQVAIFTAEALLKIVSMGFLLAPGTYLRDGRRCWQALLRGRGPVGPWLSLSTGPSS